MHFRCTAKSAAYRLSIAGRVLLALALAIGASGVVFSGAGLRFMPFFIDDAQTENADAATGKADSIDAAKLPKLQKGNGSIEANSRPETRKLDYTGKARSKRIKGILLSARGFILDKQLQSDQDGFDSEATGFLIPGGLNSW